MKNPNRRAGALALAIVMVMTAVAESGAGVILISTRNQQDTGFSTEYVSDERGPGMTAPGDVGLGALLNDNGYSTRVLLDRLLGPLGEAAGFPPALTFLSPVNPDLAISLLVVSGSSASVDVPPPPAGIPVMMGEHVTLGNNSSRAGSLFLYNGTQSNDPNETTGGTGASRYMKVLLPEHPIMAGLPLDAQGRVKIFRERYPDEEAHVPAGGKKNFEYRWCSQAAADAIPDLAILGVLDGAEDRSVFAVADAGALLANNEVSESRRVHMFINENGSGGSRRVFYALTEVGRLLLVRAAKWAMGETLEPVRTFRITEVAPAGAGQLRVSWQGTAAKNYRIVAGTEAAGNRWQTVVDDIPGEEAVMSRTLDVSAAPSSLFLQVRTLP